MISQIIVFMLGFLFGLFISAGIYFIYLKKEKYIFNSKKPHSKQDQNIDRTDNLGLIDVNTKEDSDLPFIDSGRDNISLKYTKRRYDRGFHRRNNFNYNVHQASY